MRQLRLPSVPGTVINPEGPPEGIGPEAKGTIIKSLAVLKVLKS